METPRFELFAFWRSSAAFRVRVALRLKGLAWEERYVDLEAGDQLGAAFLKVNPAGAVPALLDRVAGGPPMTQSLAILEYLEEVVPEPALLPGDPAGRARVRSLSALLTADTHPLITPRMRKYLTSAGGFDADAWRAWQIQWFTTGLQAFEKRLATEAGTGTFCHGEVVGMADICLASILAVVRVFKIEVADIPTIDRIIATCDGMEAFAASAPGRQIGAPAV